MTTKVIPYNRDAEGRVETGAVQIGDDWPGVFIRGDEALMGLAPAVKLALEQLTSLPAGNLQTVIAIGELRSLLKLLESCNVHRGGL